MENSFSTLPMEVQDPISRFDYYSNRIKLEYLTCCLTKKFNAEVMDELKTYYGEDVVLAGGMNEAFRWFIGNPDVESVEPLPTGEPFVEMLKARKGTGNLFDDYDPKKMDTCIQLNAACKEIKDAFLQAPSLETKVAIMTEFFAVKVTCHDIFIHGRGDEPSHHLLNTPFVHIEPKREIDYITQVLQSPPDDFRVKNILSYAMASGIDPVCCLLERTEYKHRDRSTFISLLKTMLERISEINANSFFRWDIYGICNFIEGPVFLRKSKDKRCVSSLAEAWENYQFNPEETCSQASDHIAREAFSIIFDHSEIIQSGSPEYFLDPINRLSLLKIIEKSQYSLNLLFRRELNGR